MDIITLLLEHVIKIDPLVAVLIYFIWKLHQTICDIKSDIAVIHAQLDIQSQKANNGEVHRNFLERIPFRKPIPKR